MSIAFEIRKLTGIIATERFDKTTIVIGTGSDCDLVLSAKPEDTFRFCVELGENGATVRCLHDVGMMINRSPVFKKGETRPLRHGDVIRLVGTEHRITFSYTSKRTIGAVQSGTSVEDNSVSSPSAVELTSEESVADSAGHVMTKNELRITAVRASVVNVLREQRRVIAAVCIGLVLLLVLIFTIDSAPDDSGAVVSDELPEVEIEVVVDEHQTKVIDLLDAVRRLGKYSSLTIENIAHPVDVNSAIVFDPDKRRILFSPSETDAPKEFAVHLQCVVTLPDSAVQLQQSIAIWCVFNEVTDLPIVKPIRSIQIGLSKVRPISLIVDAFDPDSPRATLIYTASKQLPEGATLDPITGAFDWIPAKSQYGENYSMVINVTKKTMPKYMSTVEFGVQLVDDSELNNSRKSYEDSLYVLWLKDPTEVFIEPFATTVAIAPGILATNATTIMELQKQVLNNWTVWVGRIGQEDLVPVSEMWVHEYFPRGRMEYGEGSYQSIFFDVGVVRASGEFVQSFVEVIDSESYLEVSASHDVDLMSVNIAERLQDSTEVLSSKFTRGKSVSGTPFSIVESSEVPDFAILEVEGVFPEFSDGAPLLIDGKLLGLYSTPTLVDNHNEKTNHLFTVPICLSSFDADSPCKLWVPAAIAFPQSE
jgi:hypothetical protein